MHISYYMWFIQPDILWEVILFCPDNCLSTKNIQYRWDGISWCMGIILQCELRTPVVILLCHKMTLHMSVREPLYDVNKTLTEAFHHNIMQLSFYNPNTDIVLRWTQPEICVTSWEASPSSTTQVLNKYIYTLYIDETVLHGVWESFSNMRDALPVISLYHIMTPHKSVRGGGGIV